MSSHVSGTTPTGVPQVLTIVDRLRYIAVRKAKKLVRGGIIRALAGEVGGFAVLTLTFFVNLAVVDHLVFVHWLGREEHDQIVPVLRFDLSLGMVIQIR